MCREDGHVSDDPGEDAVVGSYGSMGAFSDVCLVHAIRGLGIPVSPDRHGPFSIADGNRMLKPYGYMLHEVDVAKALVSGKMVLHRDFHFTSIAVRPSII